MAIGSAPEIGAKFTTWGAMDEFSRTEWYRHVRENWAGNIMSGFAKIRYADEDRKARINLEWECEHEWSS